MYKVLIALFAAPALGALPTCSEYCTQILKVCNGTNDQFTAPGMDAVTANLFCNVICPVYPAGVEGDVSGDSLGCRAYHLGVAQMYSDMGDMGNVTYHCPHAGFYGGGACGMPVDFQCDFMASKCAYPGTHGDCTTEYNKYSVFLNDPMNMAFTKSLLKVTGTTLQCRTANAFTLLNTSNDATLSCTEAQPASSACGQLNCADYCTLEGSVCGFGTTGNNQFADSAACNSACMNWLNPPFNTTQTVITTGDTSACRLYHLNVASTSAQMAQTHCPHTASYPDAYCMSTCDNYCSTIQAACMGENMQFADNTECMTACANYTSLAAGFTRPVATGNNLQCRAYHAVVASTGWSQARTHCVHAGKMSTPDTCGTSSASSLKVGAATAFLLLVGAVSAVLGF